MPPAAHQPLPLSQPWAVEIIHAKVYRCQPEWRIPEQTQPYDDLFLLTRGSGWVSVQGERLDARPGDLFILRRGQKMAAGHDPADPIDVYSAGFNLTSDGWAGLLQGMVLRPRLRLTPAQARAAEVELAEVSRGHAGTAPADRLSAAAAMLRAVAMTLRWAAELPARQQAGRAEAVVPPDPRLEPVLALIERHLATPLRLSDLAAAAHLSPAHFAQWFRRQTTRSPMGYLRERRIQTARALLAEGTLTVEQVAARVGFDDPFHFSRVFRRSVGMPPRLYAQSIRNPFNP